MSVSENVYVRAGSQAGERRVLGLLELRERWLSHLMWVLETKLRSSLEIASALNC